jgi:hypothetical protein
LEYIAGRLEKLRVHAVAREAHYAFHLSGAELPLNALIGRQIALVFEGHIQCIACGRATRKSYSQGYCYPCAQQLPECDLCIVNPSTCHFDRGTCRDAVWAASHCHQDHVVYLANTSGLKVGITRVSQMPTRWLDQGATQALAILRARTRHHSGMLEALLREHVADRTDWRRMLKGDAAPMDLHRERDRLLDACAEGLDELRARFGDDAFLPMAEAQEHRFAYPVAEYPQKVLALGFDKTPRVEGTLLGIKGQYLILDTGVLNVRKHTGYQVKVAV